MRRPEATVEACRRSQIPCGRFPARMASLVDPRDAARVTTTTGNRRESGGTPADPRVRRRRRQRPWRRPLRRSRRSTRRRWSARPRRTPPTRTPSPPATDRTGTTSRSCWAPPTTATSTKQIQSKELCEKLREALIKLPCRQAEAFCMRYLNDMSQKEIASQLGITNNAAGVLVHRARLKLQQILESYNNGGEL